MMDRDEALNYIGNWPDWPEDGSIPVKGSPKEWSWWNDGVRVILVHPIHDAITYDDWKKARAMVLTAPIPQPAHAKLTPTAEPDMVNHPPHYQSDNGIECIDAIRAALGREGFIAYCRGNAIKYLWRDKVDNVEDRNKAIWYINRANAEETAQ